MIHSSIRLSDDDEARSYGAEFTKKQEIEKTQKPVDFSPGQNYHWYEEIKKAQNFYKKIFGLTKFPDLPMPKHHLNINRVTYIFDDISEEDYRKAYAKKFGENQIFVKLINGLDIVKPVRPKGDYVIGYFDDPEVHLIGLSHNDALETGTIITDTREYLATAFMRRYEKGDRYDKQKMTILSTVVGGKARVMYLSKDGRMFPKYVDLNATSPFMGYRRIELA
jgi:hypothetical protein